MPITFDPAKRDKTLAERGLDFADVDTVIDGAIFEFEDTRTDYGEVRVTSIGHLDGRMIVAVWTERGANRHVISMRKANDREKSRYAVRLD